MLHFLGDGSAFHVDAENTSAYFKQGDALILIDCGERICNIILKAGILDGVKRVHLFVTHTHSDHVGSLEGFIYYILGKTKIELKVYYSEPQRLTELLALQGLDDYEIYPFPGAIEGITVEAVPQEHIRGAYGFFFYGEGLNFFYSADTHTIHPRCVSELQEGKIGRIYHEVTFTTSKIHTPIWELEQTFPREIRKQVYLMHFEDENCRTESEQKGFSVVRAPKY